MRTLSTFGLRRRAMALFIVVLSTTIGIGVTSASAGNSKYAGIVIDAKTGKTLYSHKADATRYPASLTKMMTLYMVFEAFADRKMSKSSRIRISKYAASKQPSKLGIKPGGSLTAEQAVYALVTKSANDVAAAVGEHLGGTESHFAVLMTRKAHQLGMSRTTFKNASGLPSKGQVTTARDMARLGIALREHFPEYYKYFSTRSFKYGKNRYGNHNRLLGRVNGVDGIKTGYTRASGFNLVTSVQVKKRSIVGVVLGGRTGKSRNAQMTSMISKYLRKASRGSKKQLIASRKSSGFVLASAIELPKKGPIPLFRARGNSIAQARIIAAHSVNVASAGSTTQGFGAGSDAVGTKILSYSSNELPVPALRPVAEIPNTDPVMTAAVPQAFTASGWQIQIGATESKAGAIGLLNKAQAKAPSALAGTRIYTETVDKGSAVLHRARFVGFSDKSAAREACRALKRKKFDCLTLHS